MALSSSTCVIAVLLVLLKPSTGQDNLEVERDDVPSGVANILLGPKIRPKRAVQGGAEALISRADGGVSPEVGTTSGTVVGVTLKEASAFYEIPYALPPVGNLRFKYPVLFESDDVVNATFNDYIVCYQGYKECYEGQCYTNRTEDCLVLNVFVPATIDLSDSGSPPQERLPVLLYIHGGSFLTGAGTEQLLDGRWLSNVTNTIIVTINYRLGVFGFIVYGEGDDAFPGNQGVKDQQLAMQWVQDNIENFGGDKNMVTIFGNSAGAQSVLFHLVSPVSDPLFQRGILQSWPHFPHDDLNGTLKITDYVISLLNCSGDAAKCLLNASPETLLTVTPGVVAKQLAQGGTGYIEPFRPFVDGVEIKDQPIKLVQDGLWQKKKELLLGTTLEELPGSIGTPVASSQQFLTFNTLLLGEEIGTAAAERYEKVKKEEGMSYTEVWALEQSHFLFSCPVRALARFAYNTSEKQVFLYGSNHVPEGQTCIDVYFYDAICGTAFHTSELPVLFRSGPSYGYTFNDNDKATSDQFATYWGSFARTGDPSNGLDVPLRDVLTWPPYEKDTWSNIQIQAPIEILVEKYLEDICDFWDGLGYYAIIDNGARRVSEGSVLHCLLALILVVLGHI